MSYSNTVITVSNLLEIITIALRDVQNPQGVSLSFTEVEITRKMKINYCSELEALNSKQ